jgi:hypothetical protein
MWLGKASHIGSLATEKRVCLFPSAEPFGTIATWATTHYSRYPHCRCRGYLLLRRKVAGIRRMGLRLS